ncbi:MAG TPA: HEAT repeat domain-containing protein, partial [Planctomycetaceae bacterium]
ETRRAAASRFITAGPAARAVLPALIDHLGDRDPIVQLDLAQAIWEIDRKGHTILPLLFDLLLTNRGNARIGAVYLLGQMGPAAIDTLPWLTQLLNDSHSYDRLLLAAAISRIDPTRRTANEILIGGLYHANADVRYLSIVALSAAPLARFSEADQALRAVVADRQPRVRRAAGEALGQWEARIETARAAQPSRRDRVMPAAASDAPSR